MSIVIEMATFSEYNPTVVTRDSPCWIPGTCLPDTLYNIRMNIVI